jgi:hypothetical protein
LRKRSPELLLEPSLLRLDDRCFVSTASAVAWARAVVVSGSVFSGVCFGLGVWGYEADVVGARERKAESPRPEAGEDIL